MFDHSGVYAMPALSNHTPPQNHNTTQNRFSSPLKRRTHQHQQQQQHFGGSSGSSLATTSSTYSTSTDASGSRINAYPSVAPSTGTKVLIGKAAQQSQPADSRLDLKLSGLAAHEPHTHRIGLHAVFQVECFKHHFKQPSDTPGFGPHHQGQGQPGGS